VLTAIDAAEPRVKAAIDLGCGTAQLTHDLARRFTGAQVVGVDLSDAMLQAARKRLGAEAPPLLRANAYALPFAGGSVDLVTSTISYHWYTEPARALAEVHRVLRPGGVFVLATLATKVFHGVVARARLVSGQQHAADLSAAGFTIASTIRVRPSVRVFTCRR
jgi:malonyl-CoA O-methyltransferase